MGRGARHALRLVMVLVSEAVVFGLVLLAFRSARLRVMLTPGAFVRGACAVGRSGISRSGRRKRTAARVGVLLYLSLDERLAEIVADQAIHAKVPPERWGDAMVALVDAVRAGNPARGMAAAVGQIGTIVAEHFPKTEDDRNELPDRLIEL